MFYYHTFAFLKGCRKLDNCKSVISNGKWEWFEIHHRFPSKRLRWATKPSTLFQLHWCKWFLFMSISSIIEGCVLWLLMLLRDCNSHDSFSDTMGVHHWIILTLFTIKFFLCDNNLQPSLLIVINQGAIDKLKLFNFISDIFLSLEVDVHWSLWYKSGGWIQLPV